MGPLQGIMSMLPGIPKEIKNTNIDDREMVWREAVIRSMTPAERQDPKIINGSRRSRIATGSGTSVTMVNQLVGEFDQMRRLMRDMTGIRPGRTKKGKKKGQRVTPPRAAAPGSGPKAPGQLPSLPSLEELLRQQ
jgi:signal recognition particle subunit SRP54